MNQIILILIRIIGRIHITIRLAPANLIAKIVHFGLISREKKIIDLQIKKFLPSVYSKIFSFENVLHFTKVFLICTNSKSAIKNASVTIKSSTGVSLKEVQSLTSGALALTGHIGSWDLLGGYFSSQGLKLYTVGKKARNPLAQFILEQLRQDNNIETIWRDDEKSARTLLKLFKSKNVVAALLDQDTPVRSDWINFFGQPAKTPTGIVELAIKLKVPIYTAFLILNNESNFTIYLDRIEQTTEIDVLTKYHENLEKVIKLHPLQWVWFHKRWRTPKLAEKPMSTSEYISWLS
jgi:lauroyl/myristoyl acyltransferase